MKQFLQLLLHYKLWCKQGPTGQVSLVFAAQGVTKVGSKAYCRRFQKDSMHYPERVRINLPKIKVHCREKNFTGIMQSHILVD